MHATQFFEFGKSIADAGAVGNCVRLAPVLIQPMSADDVARAVVSACADQREVIADPYAGYFGA